MSSSIVILSKSKHAALTYSPVQDYGFAAGMSAIPLLMPEVERMADCFVIIFPREGTATPHALTGLGGRNIFVDQRGRWTAPCMPLAVANYPFSLAAAPFTHEEERREPVLAVDEDAPHFRKKKGTPLYDGEGGATDFLKDLLRRMGGQYRLYLDSRKALAELQLSGVLRESSVRARVDGRERSVGGLCLADRQRVMALPDATLAGWARNGLLAMLFAHWHSLRHLETLLRDPSCPAAQEPAPSTPEQ